MFSIRFRLQSLDVLEDKARRSMKLLDDLDFGEHHASYRFYWLYSQSLIRCVTRKWKEVTNEDYPEVAYLHDNCLRLSLLNNILLIRKVISDLPDGFLALEKWDELWAGFDD